MRGALSLIIGWLWVGKAFGYNPQSMAAWQPGEIVRMEIELGSTGTLLDGSTSWNQPILAAMAEWNRYIGSTRLEGIANGTARAAKQNGANTLVFGSNAYGEAWPARVLALAFVWESGGRRTETDIAFNSGVTWNSYRGTPRDGVYDIQRVALHELGHSIGLDHPDDIGQSVGAVMNSTYSDGDTLLQDDIDGAAFLYHTNDIEITAQPPSFTAELGNSVRFTVTATKVRTYQWNKNGIAILGATDSTLLLTNIQKASAGNYTVTLANASSTVTSAPGILTVDTEPELSSLLTFEQVLPLGSPATLVVKPGSTPAPTLQWQISTDGGDTWKDLTNNETYSGVNTPALAISSIVSGMNGNRYRCFARNRLGTTWLGFRVTVANGTSAPVFTTQPIDFLIKTGNRVTWKISVEGSPTPLLAWQVSKDAGIAWSNVVEGNGYVGTNLTLFELQPATKEMDGYQYRCVASNAAGVSTSLSATLRVSDNPVAPTVLTQPLAQAVPVGATAKFTVSARGTETLNYIWRKDDGVVVYRLGPTLTISNAQASDGGRYWVEISNNAGEVVSEKVLLTVVTAGAARGRFANIATRAYCTSGNGVTIGGFVISSNGPKKVLVRAVGPSLSAQGIGTSELLADPVVEVHDASHGNVIVAANDNWAEESNAAEITSKTKELGAAPLLAGDSKSSALLRTLPPGVYSFVVSGKVGSSGIVLLEVYDADEPSAASTFLNIATRAKCMTGNGVTIGGFVVSSGVAKQVLLRAVGPTLTTQGLDATEVLGDPSIEVHDAVHGNVIIATNDDWQSNANATDIRTTGARIGAAPLNASDTKSSALLLTLPSGVYSFVVNGKSAQTGVVLLEVYDAD